MLLLDSASGSDDDDQGPNRGGGAQAIKILNTTEPDHADFLMTQQDGDEVTIQKQKSPVSQKEEPKK
jgi:hypothetical protein